MEEEQKPKAGKVKLTRLAWVWFGVLGLSMLSTWPLGHFDNATELTPTHDDILDYCFWVAGFIAIASMVIGFLQSEGALASRLLMSVLGFGILGGVAGVLVLGTIASIIENREDFPPQATRTFTALIPIERAYRMDSRTGSSWIIQPYSFGVNIDIAHADYRLMLTRSGAANVSKEPWNVPSRRYFCAKVTAQQSGEALRVLHAGSQALPPGSVGVCSEMASNDHSLPVIG